MSALGPGEIRFQDHALPALAAGDYQITVTQAVTRAKEELQTFTRTQRLRVEGPRFGLGADDVHAVYPPANSAGNQPGVLPHVVLRRRSLPWEVDLFGDNAERDLPVPWLALLVFHQEETPQTLTGTYAELWGSDAARTRVLPSYGVNDQPAGDLGLTVVDVPRGTSDAVLPAVDDLPWTAHVRQVRTDAKELLGLEDDGWFSVLIANRVPGPGVNTVHLVSLEGIDLSQQDAANDKRPRRFVSLASWSFSSTTGGSFAERMKRLDVGLLRPDRGGPSRGASDADPAGNRDPGTLVDQAVGDGFVPLRYGMRHGETTVAWYRGPLTPVRVPHAEAGGPLPSAEAGLVYHPGLGMFDASHAVAWQLGRLLGLSDPAFAGALMRWRQRVQAQGDWLAAQDEVRAHHERVGTLRDVGDLVQRVDAWRDGEDGAPGAAEDREQERQVLARELRDLVLKIRDPDALATEVARHAAVDVLTPLLGPVLPAIPDGKARLAGAVGQGTADE